jgi:hypothetical protein
MGRKVRSIVKGKYCSAYFLQHVKADETGRRIIKIRVSNGKTVDSSVYYPDLKSKPLKVLPEHFNGNSIKGGYPDLVSVNLFLLNLQIKAVEVADRYHSHDHFNAEILKNELYGITEQADKQKEVQQVFEGYSKKEIKSFNQKLETGHFVDETGELDFEDADDMKHAIEWSIQEDNQANELQSIHDIEQYYDQKTKHPRGHDPIFLWNYKNIFECLGYIRYGTIEDAAGDIEPIINKSYHRLFKKFIYYRINATPSESIEKFDENWIHNFYKFIYNTGFERRLQKTVANPLIIDKTFKIQTPANEREFYSQNTFGDQIHKQTVAYVKKLFINKLIPVDFSARINAKAFLKKFDGQLTNYDSSRFNLSVQEFLGLIHYQPSTNELVDTKNIFICQTLIGALRISDLKKKKIINELDHLKILEVRQTKTGGLLKNVVLKPVEKILGSYKNELPAQKNYNENLKKLFTEMVKKGVIKQRMIDQQQNKLKEGGKVRRGETEAMHDVISSKFARSTHYVVLSALGYEFEEIVKRAGHKSINIAMKHYYDVGKNYTREDVTKLLEYFK